LLKNDIKPFAMVVPQQDNIFDSGFSYYDALERAQQGVATMTKGCLI
jgi:hypothetical protein